MPDHIDPEQEQGLVSRARDDPDALQALYRLYVRRIYGYVASRINNRQDAEDVVSEVFLRMVRTLDRFSNRHSYSFSAWIFTIARNAVSDYYRDRRKTECDVPQKSDKITGKLSVAWEPCGKPTAPNSKPESSVTCCARTRP